MSVRPGSGAGQSGGAGGCRTFWRPFATGLDGEAPAPLLSGTSVQGQGHARSSRPVAAFGYSLHSDSHSDQRNCRSHRWPADTLASLGLLPRSCRSTADAAQLLALINAERAKAGVAPVSLSAAVSTMAQKHACDNAAAQSISHVGSDGATLAERLRRDGLRVRHAAENTGLGFATPQAAMAFWMARPGIAPTSLRPKPRRSGSVRLMEARARLGW